MRDVRNSARAASGLGRRAWIAVVGLALLAFLLRVYRLDYVPLRGDESFTVIFLSDPLPAIWDGIRFVEPNPPLFYLLLYAFMGLAGATDFAVRYFSVFFGVLAVPLAYVLGRRLARPLGPLAALVAAVTALLVAINPYQIWHSQDLRNYTIWPAFSIAALYLMLRALDENRPRLWIGYVVAALLALYTHYFEVFLVVFQNVYVFAFYWRRWPRLRRWIAAQVVLVALYAPWPLVLSSRPFTYVDLTDVPGLPALILNTLSNFTLGETVSQLQARIALPAIGLLLILGLSVAYRRRRRAFFFLTLYLGVPLLCTLAFLQFQPVFRERYLNAIAPGYYLTLAFALAGLARLPARRRLWVLPALAAVLLINGVALGQYYFDAGYSKSPDWRALARYLETHADAQDVIVQTYPDPGLAHYYHGSAERLVLPDRSAVDQIGDLPVDRVETAQTLADLLADHNRLWLVPITSNWDPDSFVAGWLDRRAEEIQADQVAGFRVLAYRRAERPQPSFEYPVEARFGDGIRLLGYDLTPEQTPIRPGTALEVALYWEAFSPGETDYTVFVHLVNADGTLVAQHDDQPQAGDFPTSDWLPGDVIRDPHPLFVPGDASPGTYHLRVGLYQPASGARVPAFDASGRRWPDDAVALQPTIDVVEP